MMQIKTGAEGIWRKDNPWERIELEDYEAHMKLDSVMQLQALGGIMKGQLSVRPCRTVMILGVAGGNGLEHVTPERFERIWGVDINAGYLAQCCERYPGLRGIFEPVRRDLTREDAALPGAELVVADLIIEYIGCERFAEIIETVSPSYVSCVIQNDGGEDFVSESPYADKLKCLDGVHRQIGEEALADRMAGIGYDGVLRKGRALPNGKKLLRLDFERAADRGRDL